MLRGPRREPPAETPRLYRKDKSTASPAAHVYTLGQRPSQGSNVDYVRLVHTRTPKEGCFAQVRFISNGDFAAGRGVTGCGVRPGHTSHAGSGDDGGRGASH